ncbi:MAG: hypothetical protein CL903_02185 [Dehalococcoidia bacterium]|nr:hypothetical protein [Dehalococcoidia bacterium]
MIKIENQWLEISINTPSEFVEPFTQILIKNIGENFSVERDVDYNPDEGEIIDPNSWVRIKAWMPADDTLEVKKNSIDVSHKLLNQIIKLPNIDYKYVSINDWKNQKFDPIEIGKNLVILPTKDYENKFRNKKKIYLEPGLAFGTGHHPTTKMCIEELEKRIHIKDTILDVGCGSGILMIAAQVLGASKSYGIDIDDDAINSAKNNIKNAGYENDTFLANTKLSETNFPKKFDLVMANIASKVLIEISSELISLLSKKSTLIISGILGDKINDVIKSFELSGGKVINTRSIDSWHVSIIKRGF